MSRTTLGNRTARLRALAKEDPVIAELLEPLSGQQHPTQLQRHYTEGAGRQARIEGDQDLLIRLEKAMRNLPRVGDEPPTVAELGEAVVQQIVDEVEELHFGSWRVDRDPDRPILGALDAHFRPLQEVRVEQRQLNADLRGRRAQAAAENAPRLAEEALENERRYAAIWGLAT